MMSESFSRKRPSFDQFRHWFMESVNRHAGVRTNNPLAPWQSVGDEATRQAIVESFMCELESKFGFRPVVEDRLHTLDCPVESVVNKIFHVFSTMLLVEHVNAKMYGKKSAGLH